VLVIGAGITGAMAAEQLTDAGLSVVVLDRRGAVRGSTLASTALLQYEIDTPLAKLATRIGRMHAERIWRRSRLALDAMRDRTRRLGIAADCADKSSLYLEGNVLDAAGLRVEAKARRRAGFEVRLLSADAVRDAYGIRGRTGLLSYHNLEANPRRLAVGFLRIALARGGRFYAPVEAVAVESHASGVTILTDQATIRARHVVFATGYELPKGVPRKGHRIATTWAIATRPQPRGLWAGHGFIWEASDPYLYLRVGPDGRIVCGGEARRAQRREDRRYRRQAGQAPAACRRARRLWLVREFRHLRDRHAIDRAGAGHEALLCRAGLWRQRHHLLDDGRPDPARSHLRRRRCGRRLVFVYAAILGQTVILSAAKDLMAPAAVRSFAALRMTDGRRVGGPRSA
jgi:glycine/D-amino acid oxidase-like deaminating enzyme